MLRDAGFSKVIAEDRTEQVPTKPSLFFTYSIIDLQLFNLKSVSVFLFQFLKVLQKELDTVEKEKNEFIQDFSEVSTMISLKISVANLPYHSHTVYSDSK